MRGRDVLIDERVRLPGRRIAEPCMGTVISIDLRGALVDPGPALTWLHDVDERFSTYRADSEVSRLAHGALALLDCHPDVAEVLAIGAAAQERSRGAFTLHPAGRLDPSGVVKGWAVEHASWLLAVAGSTAHLVNGGGDVQTHGPDPWRIAVADPLRRGRILDVATGRGIAVATSGSAERGGHVVDARTGRSADHHISVTVVGTTGLTDVDIAATTAFALGPDAQDWLAQRPDLGALGVARDGSVWTTPGWRHFQQG